MLQFVVTVNHYAKHRDTLVYRLFSATIELQNLVQSCSVFCANAFVSSRVSAPFVHNKTNRECLPVITANPSTSNTPALQAFHRCENLLCCPLCGQSGSIKNKSFVCGKGHCYDISAKGYINFVPHKRSGAYEPISFASRGALFDQGFYRPVADKIAEIVLATAGTQATVLDVGCGEGYYADDLIRRPVFQGKLRVLGADIEKRAILAAARRKNGAAWLVADSQKLPIAAKSISVVLNCLAPASYAEYRRVLADDGVLIKIIPGQGYLEEIRTLVKDHLKHPEHSSAPVLSHFKQHLRHVETYDVSYQLPLTSEQAAHFFHMTPMTQKIDAEPISFEGIKTITIDLSVLIGRK